MKSSILQTSRKEIPALPLRQSAQPNLGSRSKSSRNECKKHANDGATNPEAGDAQERERETPNSQPRWQQLYEEHKKKNEQRERMIKRKREEDAARELAGASFRP